MAMLGNSVLRAALSETEVIVRQGLRGAHAEPANRDGLNRNALNRANRTGRRVLRSAAEMPSPLIDFCITEMAQRLSRTPEARACAGLSFTFISRDVAVAPARYQVCSDGAVEVCRGKSLAATFTFLADADTFDSVLRGRESALLAILQRRVHMEGSLTRFRSLLRMLPAVQEAYCATRLHMIEQHARRYVFAF
jgi:hypothetical protein